MKPTADRSAFRLAVLLSVYFAICIGIFAFRSLHWPLVNDPAQIHYFCFLMDRGMVPYRDTIEMNMPGTYLYTEAVIHWIGAGPRAWRFFDFALLSTISLAMIAIARPYHWAAGVFGAAVFVLYHGRDGPGELGQRDLVIAALMMTSYAFLFYAMRRGKSWPMIWFGLCAGMASAIKPFPLPFFIALLIAAGLTLRQRDQPVMKFFLFALSGLMIAGAIVISFLLRKHDLGAFVEMLRDLLPYYASLHRSFLFLLATSLSPSLRLMALLIVAITIFRRDWHGWEQCAILAGILFGIVSYLGQGKGFVYHRYPMLAFLLLWGGIQFTLALRESGISRAVGIAGIAAGVILAPIYVAEAGHKQWNEKYIAGLTQQLTALGGAQLSEHVQCLDTTAECDTVLDRMRLVQSTGLMYDFWVFGTDQEKAVVVSRRRFWQQLQQNPPTAFIVGPDLYPNGPDGYAKLKRWAQFSHYLGTNYNLYDERTFGSANYPLAYRIYLRKRVPTVQSPPMIN